MDFLVDKEYIEVEVGQYNELIRTKAKWDLLIDNIIHANYKDFETEEVNNWINTYYSKFGIKLKEKTVDTEYIKEYKRRKPLEITEEGVQ